MSTSSPAATPQAFTGRLALETPLGAVLSDNRIRLLEAIERCGSLSRAAREVPLSYKAAWDALDGMNNLAPEPLVRRATGGAGGGGTQLTDYARRLIALYRAMERAQQDVLDRIAALPANDPAAAAPLHTLIRRLAMKTSARNQFAARVTGLTDLGGSVEVRLALGDAATPGETVVASITPESLENLALRLGSEVHALVKAPAVQLSTRAPRARSGLNVLAGVVAELRPGAQRCRVALRLPSGRSLHGVADARTAPTFQPGRPAWGRFEAEQVVLISFG